MFQCPTCAVRLQPVQHGRFRAWRCPTCNGHATTVEAVRRVASARATHALWFRVTRGAGRPSRFTCPSCRGPMQAVALGDDARALELDACRRCRFLWFEPGEVAALKAYPPDPVEAEPQIRDLPMPARVLFAKAMADRVRERAEADEPGQPDVEAESPWQGAAAFFRLPFEVAGNEVSIVPWFTWGLAALLFAISASVLAWGDVERAAEAWGFVPAAWTRHLGLTALTAFFLHADWVHLFGNLYFLLVFGDNVEEALGRRRAAALVVGATLAGAALHGGFGHASTVTAIGASGGISGVIAYYALRFPGAKLAIAPVPYRPMTLIVVPAVGLFALWVLLQGVEAAFVRGGLSRSGAFAHLGGAAVGVGAWAIPRLAVRRDRA